MKKTILRFNLYTIAIIIFWSCSTSQKEISTDSQFVKTYENGIVELKDSIPDGDYVVTTNYHCDKKDTILIGSVRNGVRDGKWIYYDEYSLFPCESEIVVLEIDLYEKGNLVSCEYHTGSGVINTIYQKNQKEHNGERIKSSHLYDDGSSLIDSSITDGIIRLAFDKGGVKEARLRMVKDTSFVVQYFPSGIKNFEYKLVEIQRERKWDEVFDGLSKSWNKDGELIDVVKYDMGNIVKGN